MNKIKQVLKRCTQHVLISKGYDIAGTFLCNPFITMAEFIFIEIMQYSQF